MKQQAGRLRNMELCLISCPEATLYSGPNSVQVLAGVMLPLASIFKMTTMTNQVRDCFYVIHPLDDCVE